MHTVHVSKAWAGGSTRAHRHARVLVYQRDGPGCRAHQDGLCASAKPHRCQRTAPLHGLKAGHAHHVHGKQRTGDDPNHMVWSCAPCNQAIGEPHKTPDPRGRGRTQW